MYGCVWCVCIGVCNICVVYCVNGVFMSSICVSGVCVSGVSVREWSVCGVWL